MKKKFLILSMAALLSFTACGPSKKGDSSSVEQGYVDPEVQLDDAFDKTMDIEFDEIEDTCMINPKAKVIKDIRT